jgi:hypothetical protein
LHLERLVQSVYRDVYADCDVFHVGGPGDGGFDVLMIRREDPGESYLIQVKRRSSASSVEGVSVVRDLVGAMILEGATRGIVVSTADRFSGPARQAADKAARRRRYVELHDRHRFGELTHLTTKKPGRPWDEAFEKDYFKWWYGT